MDVDVGELEVSVGIMMVGKWPPVGGEYHRRRY